MRRASVCFHTHYTKPIPKKQRDFCGFVQLANQCAPGLIFVSDIKKHGMLPESQCRAHLYTNLTLELMLLTSQSYIPCRTVFGFHRRPVKLRDSFLPAINENGPRMRSSHSRTVFRKKYYAFARTMYCVARARRSVSPFSPADRRAGQLPMSSQTADMGLNHSISPVRPTSVTS